MTEQMKKANHSTTIHQFKITLRGTSPPVWRRIQVPASYTLFQLHRAIVSAMGWYGECSQLRHAIES